MDNLTKEVAFKMLEENNVSCGFIQRRFMLGYNRSGRIMDELEKLGIVSAFQGNRPRYLLITTKDELESIFNLAQK